jgi:hypothetical protein
MRVCVCVCMYVCMYVCVCMYVRIYVCMYVPSVLIYKYNRAPIFFKQCNVTDFHKRMTVY